ncbi:MAG: Spy/CpxP family protein refolding chaperone [Coleofasciculaceae cyanobacterium SM2_1_6]|nr:Spy/CpxP family protein refolding chaperone [Coleofasciculaceae cyanobacterium SM2_1_6]
MALLVSGAMTMINPAAFAQPGNRPERPAGGMQRLDRDTMRQTMEDRITRELNLTPAQVSRSQEIRQQYANQIEPLETQIRQIREELRTLLGSSTSTEAQIRQKHQEVQQLRQQIGNLRFDGQLAFRQILTPEQIQTLGQRMPRGGEGMSRRERTPRS